MDDFTQPPVSRRDIQKAELQCPHCGQRTHSLKRYDLWGITFLLVVFILKEKYFVGCPHCMRKAILKNLISEFLFANVTWPILLIRALFLNLASLTRGHSKTIVYTILQEPFALANTTFASPQTFPTPNAQREINENSAALNTGVPTGLSPERGDPTLSESLQESPQESPPGALLEPLKNGALFMPTKGVAPFAFRRTQRCGFCGEGFGYNCFWNISIMGKTAVEAKKNLEKTRQRLLDDYTVGGKFRRIILQNLADGNLWRLLVVDTVRVDAPGAAAFFEKTARFNRYHFGGSQDRNRLSPRGEAPFQRTGGSGSPLDGEKTTENQIPEI